MHRPHIQERKFTWFKLSVFKVESIKTQEVKAIIEFKNLGDFERFLFANAKYYYFENEDAYFAIVEDILYIVKKKQKKGGGRGEG